jgi:hypothetical protein
VRQLIEAGGRPNAIPSRIRRGDGRGDRCEACGSDITAGECAFAIPGDRGPVVLDRGCLDLWMTSVARGG